MRGMAAADLFGDLAAAPPPGWRDHLPGLAVVTLGTLAAGFISDHYGAPLTLMALLVGLALNFLSTDPRLRPGLAFASRSLLRWGIILVGTRVTVGQIADLGPMALLCVAAIIALTTGVGILAASRLRLGVPFGVLAGGSVAICGASAAMALAAALGPKRIGEAQLTLVLVGISAMSAMAMVVYPIVAHWSALSDLRAGFFLGASIHDVAQSIGAGYAYSEAAGQIAAIVKLTRVALLAPVLGIVALFMAGKRGQGGRAETPWFVGGFFLVAAINSTGAIPAALSAACAKAAAAMLAAAVTATAIRSPLAELLEAGPRPLLVILVATLAALLLALAAALFIIA